MCVLCAKESVTTCLCVRVCVRESMLASLCPTAYIHIHLFTYTLIYMKIFTRYVAIYLYDISLERLKRQRLEIDR